MTSLRTWLKHLCINIYVNILQIRVDIQRLSTGFAGAVARLFQPPKGHVRFAPVGSSVYHSYARLNLLGKFNCAVDTASVDASS